MTIRHLFLAGVILSCTFTQEAIAQTVHGSLKVVHNGVGVIPSFTLGKPAAIGVVNVSKGAFSYTYVTGLEVKTGKLWFVDNWVHFNHSLSEYTSLSVGADWSFFFGPIAAVVNGHNTEEDVHESIRYVIGSILLSHKFTPSTSTSISYWYTEGVDIRTVDGHFLPLEVVQKLSLGDYGVTLTPSVFYISFTGPSDGVFTSLSITLNKKKWPVALTAQFVQEVRTNIKPSPGFQWGGGLVATF